MPPSCLSRVMRLPAGGRCYDRRVVAAPALGRLTDDQRAIRDAVRTLARDRVAARAAEIDRSAEFPEDLRVLLAEQGILGLPFPERHGGLGADLLTVCLAIEALSAACATTGLILAVQVLGALPLLLAGSEEQLGRFMPALASGRDLVAFALTEADAGSDAAAIRTRAVRDGETYVISGTKRFISHGSVASLVTVFAVTDPEADRHHRISAFVVETASPGFTVSRLEHKMGIRGSPTAELAFDEVRVPAANLLGAEGDGFGLAMRTLDRSRPGIAAQAVGIAQGALDAAAAYSAPWAIPTACAAMPGRDRSSVRMARRKPSPSGPSKLAAGTRTSSKASSAVGEPRIPILCSSRLTEKPGLAVSTTNAEIRRCRSASGSVTAKTVTRLATLPWLMKRFPPEITYVSPSVSYTHLRAHETRHDIVCRLLLEK